MIAYFLRVFWIAGVTFVGGCATDEVAPKKQLLHGLDGLNSSSDATSVPNKNPFDPIALNNNAVVELSKGRYEQAHTLLKRANRLAPANAEIASNLGNLERWMSLAEGQIARGLTPPKHPSPSDKPEIEVPALPPLWQAPVKSSVDKSAQPNKGGVLLPPVGNSSSGARIRPM